MEEAEAEEADQAKAAKAEASEAATSQEKDIWVVRRHKTLLQTQANLRLPLLEQARSP